MTEEPSSGIPFSTLRALQEALTQQSYANATLYVVATPIGNSADISLRALHVLALVDAVACEDTRNTAQLMTRYGLHKTLIAAHQHNEHAVAEKIIARLQAGERIALVSDAGTPAVSDPGAIIVQAVQAAGYPICPLPGASAAITALSASGLVNDQFRFIGFLPSKAGQREAKLNALQSEESSLIFYEAPHRIVETTEALIKVFGSERRIVFARELSKLFEEIHACTLGAALAWIKADAHREKGEFVLILEGAKPASGDDELENKRVLNILLKELPVKQAAALAAQITGSKKNALYSLALRLKDEAE